jgi:ABC-2 type transport system permease protein
VLSVSGSYVGATLAVLHRDWRIYMSYRFRPLSQMVSIMFTLAMFFYVSQLVRVDALGSSEGYFAFVVVGMAILQALTSTFAAGPGGVLSEIASGTFERLAVSPLGPVGGIAGSLLFPLVQSLLMGTLTIAIAGLIFGLPVHWETAPLALPAAILAMTAFTPFALFACAMMLVARQAMGARTYLVAGLSLVSGLYFPVTLLPDWIEWAAAVQPFTPAVDLLRHLLVGTPVDGSAWTEVVRLAGFAAIGLPLSIWAVRGAVRHARRRATLLEI